MKKLILFFCTAHLFCFSQPVIEWQRNFGGTSNEQLFDIQQTPDEGFIMSGYCLSNDGDVSGNHGSRDFWVLKLDPMGNVIWQKALGGSGFDVAYSGQLTSDGGYVVVGSTQSNDGDLINNTVSTNGFGDVWIVKLNLDGTIQWQKTFGGSGLDIANHIKQTNDSGYIICGMTGSNDGNVFGNQGGYDIWVLKLDNTGSLVWQKTLGGSANDYGRFVTQTSDGGYLVASTVYSVDGNISGNNGMSDGWVVKLSPTGLILWEKTYGGTLDDGLSAVQETLDGGMVVAGFNGSNDGDASQNYGATDIWVIKADNIGNITWQKSFGGTAGESGKSIEQSLNGGYIVYGGTSSPDGDVIGVNGGNDYWLLKLNSTGNMEWQNPYGGSLYEEPGAHLEFTSDGGFIIGGTTESNDKDVCSNNGSFDFWIAKLNDCASPLPTNSLEICSVGLDSLTNKNRIVWEKPVDVGIDSFYVYKEIATGVYSKIGAVDNCNDGVFIDMNSVPMDSSYRYKIAVLGMCGDTSTLSTVVHETVNLIVTPGAGGVFNLSWNPYVGFPYTTYNLYRGSDPSNITQIATLPSSTITYQDIAPPAGALFYQIEVVNPNDCDPTKINGYGVSRSNIASNGIASFDVIASEIISVYPNPTKGDMTLEVGEEIIGKRYHVLDGFGRTLFSGTIQSSKQTLELSQLSNGTYFLNVESTGSVQRLTKW